MLGRAEPSTIGVVGFFATLGLMALRVPIGFALMSVASACVLLVYAWRPGSEGDLAIGLRPAMTLIQTSVFGFIHAYDLSMMPMFIAAGRVAYRARIATDIYDSARALMARMRGGPATASIDAFPVISLLLPNAMG